MNFLKKKQRGLRAPSRVGFWGMLRISPEFAVRVWSKTIKTFLFGDDINNHFKKYVKKENKINR